MASINAHPQAKRRRIRAAAALAAALGLALFGLLSPASPAGAAPSVSCASAAAMSPRMTVHGHTAAVARLVVPGCRSRIGTGNPAVGSPPLVYHGGPVMAVPSVGNTVVMTPIFWAPAGYSFASSYKNLIVRYLNDVAAASGTNNIFATNTEYNGSNGAVHYGITVGTPINDTTALPTQECTIDSGAVYSDNSGYTACLDDDQIVAETQNVITSNSLPTNLGHMYLMFTPKHVESCFYSDAEVPSGGSNQCTINAGPTAAYCAYHSAFSSNSNAIYAEMPFPIYNSPAGPTCGSEARLPVTESPNNNPDADVEISPLSHEMSEAITDPDLNAWSDASGYENGDECAYVYGATHGTAGQLYNQTINGHHYLTQEEFSNNDYFATGGGCLQGEPRPVATADLPVSGTHNGGTLVTITGKYFPQQATVLFGTKAGKKVTHVSGTKLTVRTPSHAVGTVSVFVKTIGGTSAQKAAVKFTFK
ncbi:MAG TPA: IPT/TIG domain-containing protein [Jatrophihabitans sp.]|nr:IPT/TIG domain-containing protein [Jatrophihabitans sp.]